MLRRNRKRCWRILALAGILASAFAFTAVAADVKIGVVDTEKVMDRARKGKEITAALAEYARYRQRLIDVDEEDLRAMEEELTRQGADLSAEAKRSKEAAYSRKMEGSGERFAQFNLEIEARKREGLAKLRKDIAIEVKKIAAKQKLALVLEKNAIDEHSPIMFSHRSLDLTNRVIKALDGKKGK